MKKNKFRNVFLSMGILIMTVFVSCPSVPRSSGTGLLSAGNLNLVQNAVFEVVLDKPAEDPTVYEKELDWDRVPFVIRNDKYYSIGTAFAVSKTELVTAFHVINLGYESMVFDKYLIRDSLGNVYEVDQITGGSNEKDYLIFTVKGKTFDKFFQFEKNFKTGDTVFSIGNALGEGVVVRNGLILGTIPEEDSGRWNLLKSSADGNPGNSGGPLITQDGKVVGVVSSLRENILYSVPAEVVLGGSRTELSYRKKSGVSHLILSNKLNGVFEFKLKLPDTYAGVRKSICDAYNKHYVDAMTALFKEALGRTWISAYWVIGFDDDVQIMYILPLPNGPVIVSTRQDSSFFNVYEWDMRKICDHLFTAYSGSFDEWNNYAALNQFIPDFLKDARFNWKNGDTNFSFTSGTLSINSDKQVFDWNARSELFLAHSWYKINGKPEFGVRKVILNRDQRGKEYFIFFRNIKPDPKLGTNAMENWNDLVAGKYPLDEKPVLSPKDNTGFVGAVLKARRPNPDVIFSIYLSMENPQNEENLNRKLVALKTGVTVDY